MKLYGIDPKASELRPYDGTVFTRISNGTDRESHLSVIREVIEEMRGRFRSSDARGLRSFKPTAEVWTILLIIDELDWLLDDTKAADLIAEILAMGRGAGVFVIAAAQQLSRGGTGRTIGNFANRILFQQRSLYINDLMLGEGAAEGGADSTALEAPSYANGYAGAGVAYVTDAEGVRKIRFPEITDKDIADLIRSFEEAKN